MYYCQWKSLFVITMYNHSPIIGLKALNILIFIQFKIKIIKTNERNPIPFGNEYMAAFQIYILRKCYILRFAVYIYAMLVMQNASRHSNPIYMQRWKHLSIFIYFGKQALTHLKWPNSFFIFFHKILIGFYYGKKCHAFVYRKINHVHWKAGQEKCFFLDEHWQ